MQYCGKQGAIRQQLSSMKPVFNETKTLSKKLKSECQLISDAKLDENVNEIILFHGTRVICTFCMKPRDINNIFSYFVVHNVWFQFVIIFFSWHYITKGSTVPKIVDKGFDEHHSSLVGLFGAGCYFTDQSSKADQVALSQITKLTILFTTIAAIYNTIQLDDSLFENAVAS